jgi:hypothetical protein
MTIDLKNITDQSGNLPDAYINSSNEGDMSMEHLYKLCHGKLIAKNPKDLGLLINEMVDQKLFSQYKTDKHKPRVKSNMSVYTLMNHLKTFS